MVFSRASRWAILVAGISGVALGLVILGVVEFFGLMPTRIPVNKSSSTYDETKTREWSLIAVKDGLNKARVLEESTVTEAYRLNPIDGQSNMWNQMIVDEMRNKNPDAALEIITAIHDGEERASALKQVVRLSRNMSEFRPNWTPEGATPPSAPNEPDGSAQSVPSGVDAATPSVSVQNDMPSPTVEPSPQTSEQQQKQISEFITRVTKTLSEAEKIANALPTSVSKADVLWLISQNYSQISDATNAGRIAKSAMSARNEADTSVTGVWAWTRRTILLPVALGILCSLGVILRELLVSTSKYYTARMVAAMIKDDELAKALGVTVKSVRKSLILPHDDQ
jgi:hypothetical protein